MPDQRTGRRGDRRAFRPTLNGTLEPRTLMAATAIHKLSTATGQALLITNPAGVQFFVSVINGGTLRATVASGGRVNLFANGTTASTLLEINRVVPKHRATNAPSQSSPNNMLNIASLTLNSGIINSIEGYQTANLSGPLVVSGTVPVNRIALNSILPGGSITTGSDLYTLDIYSSATFSGATTTIGRDLDWFETSGNVDITNGGNLIVGRDVGETLQPIKGTGNGGQGINIGGNLTIDTGSTFVIGRAIEIPNAGIVVNGNLTGGRNIAIGGAFLTAGLPFNFNVVGNSFA